MKPIIILFIYILALLPAATASAATPQQSPKSPKVPEPSPLETALRRQLAEAKTPQDSLPIMLDLFDYLEGRLNANICPELYDLALRSADQETILEVTRYMANHYMKSDSVLTVLQENTRRLPESTDRDITETFIKMMKNVNHARYSPDEETKERRFQQFLKIVTLHPPTDIYERIVLLHALCVYLGDSTDGELLDKYFDQLGELINGLPKEGAPLRNLYYVQRALIYTETDHPEKAIAADRNLLSLIDSLETSYNDRGRPYRDYNANKYVIYTRMLYNYPLLPLNEVDRLYGNIRDIIAVNRRAEMSYEGSLRPDLYHALAHGNHSEALSILKRCVDLPYNRSKRRQYLKFMIDCAKSTGDKETLLWASGQYNALLEDYLNQRLQDRYKELQIVYDIYDMKENYHALEIEKQRSETKASRLELTIAVILAVGLLILVIALLYLVRKLRHLTRSLEEKNSELTVQRNSLEKKREQLIAARNEAEKANSFKATFINDFSREVAVPIQIINEYAKIIVDFVDDEHRSHIERFSKLVRNNSELLNTMVNDMVNLSELQNGTVTLHPEVVSVKDICQTAIDSISSQKDGKIRVSYDNPESDEYSIFTDRERLLQILINLLINSLKSISSGEVRLRARLDQKNEEVSFEIVGYPRDRLPSEGETRHGKPSTDQGNNFSGLSLTISRSLAKLLGGTLKTDNSFTNGIRFVLAIPLRCPSGNR